MSRTIVPQRNLLFKTIYLYQHIIKPDLCRLLQCKFLLFIDSMPKQPNDSGAQYQ